MRKRYAADFTAPLEEMEVQNSAVSFRRGALYFVVNTGECDENVKTEANFVTIFGGENCRNDKDLLTIPAGTYGVFRIK